MPRSFLFRKRLRQTAEYYVQPSWQARYIVFRQAGTYNRGDDLRLAFDIHTSFCSMMGVGSVCTTRPLHDKYICHYLFSPRINTESIELVSAQQVMFVCRTILGDWDEAWP